MQRGLFSFGVPKKSKLFREYEKAASNGEASANSFLDTLSLQEIEKLGEELATHIADQKEQGHIQWVRENIENRTYPIGFSKD